MVMNIILVLLNALLVHLIKHLHAKLDIAQQLITSALAEILSNHHSQHLEFFGVRSHCVCRHDPRAAAKLMCDSEFIVVLVEFGIEAESNEWKAFTVLFGHYDEAKLLEGLGEVVCGAGEVRHDGAVTVLAKADQLVVLADDLGGAFGEVEGEGGLVCAQVVDVEDEFFGEIFRGTPDDPAYTRVDKAVPFKY
jgi:hypothetical protein